MIYNLDVNGFPPSDCLYAIDCVGTVYVDLLFYRVLTMELGRSAVMVGDGVRTYTKRGWVYVYPDTRMKPWTLETADKAREP